MVKDIPDISENHHSCARTMPSVAGRAMWSSCYKRSAVLDSFGMRNIG
jgi:hypothetical protein